MPPISRKTSHHIAKASHLRISHRPYTSSYSLQRYVTYAAHFEIRILNCGRNFVKTHICQYVICARQSAKIQLMGDLPEPRVNLPPPFFHSTSVDYARPFGIIPFVGYDQRIRKYYIALFVCLATKAIYLKSVENYATAGFLTAFRRFVNRCSLCVQAHVYSDKLS